ncbi:hypothetical protein BV20DRAFT_1112799 [Pilatotrama ljubarskyi]|nr:hypothetical protein BV20DRAFT_1112799 [Pilatotrama ljubarskyi]
MSSTSRTRPPLLPVAISQSPLLSGALPDDLFSHLAKPLPTITIGLHDPSSPHDGAYRLIPSDKEVHWPMPPSLSSSSSDSPTSPVAPISPREVIALLNLLESMENDVATEVQRVRLGIQETRMLVRECREDCRARTADRQERQDRERRETKGPDDDFWLVSTFAGQLEARGYRCVTWVAYPLWLSLANIMIKNSTRDWHMRGTERGHEYALFAAKTNQAESTGTMDDILHVHRPPHEIPPPDASVLPSFVLIAPPPYMSPRTKQTVPSLCDAWRAALAELPLDIAARFTVKEARLNAQALAQEFGTFDCIVSPANAFGIMDGGRAFIIDGDAWALTNAVQDVLRKRHGGYLPPASGCCTMVPLPPTLTASNPLGCTSVAVVPTMRTPESVSWHRDLL